MQTPVVCKNCGLKWMKVTAWGDKVISVTSSPQSVLLKPKREDASAITISPPIDGVQAIAFGFEIWNLDDDLWEQVKKILEEQGRRRLVNPGVG